MSHTVTPRQGLTSRAPDGSLQPVAVSMAEAARLLGVSRMHLYRRLIPNGELLTFMSGGRRLVSYDELKRYTIERGSDCASPKLLSRR